MQTIDRMLEIKLTTISNYSFEFLKERLLIEENSLTTIEEIDVAIEEFKKFLSLIAMEIKPLAMISPKVDEVWHQFILFTEKYNDFCEKIMGRFIHHKPNTSIDPVPLIAIDNVINGYKLNFGTIPEIWYEGLDKDSIKYYQGNRENIKPPKKWSGWTG